MSYNSGVNQAFYGTDRESTIRIAFLMLKVSLYYYDTKDSIQWIWKASILVNTVDENKEGFNMNK